MYHTSKNPERKTLIALKIRVNGLEVETKAKPDPYSFYTILTVYPGEELGAKVEIPLKNGYRKAIGRVVEGNIYFNGQPTSGQIIFVKNYTTNIIGWKQLHDLGLMSINEHRCVIDVPPVIIKGERDPNYAIQPILKKGHLIGHAHRVLNSWVREGVIEECDVSTVCNSPINLGRKLNRKVKIYFNFKDLNLCSLAEPPHDKLDRPKAIANITLGKYYSVLQLYYGEWQIPLDTNTKYKTAFTFQGQQYVWNRLPGKFKNSNIILSKTLEKILDRAELPQNIRKRVTFYSDTMLISADTANECHEFTRKLREHLEDNGFKLTRDLQDQICKSKVEFLGREVTPDGIRLGQNYIYKIQNIFSPQNERELLSILGCLEDARQFTPGFGVLRESLTKLTKKDQEWVWCFKQEEALCTLIEQVLNNSTYVPKMQDDEPCTVQIFSKDESWMAEILNSVKKPYRSESGVFDPTKNKTDLAIQELKAMAQVWKKHECLKDRDVEWEVESPDVARYRDNPDSLNKIAKARNQNLEFLLSPRHKIKTANVRKPPIKWPLNM